MSGSVKSSLTRRILNSVSSQGVRARRRLRLSLVQDLESRVLLSASSPEAFPSPRIATTSPAPTTLPANAPAASGTTATLAPLSETFNLNSRPTATKTIYLDFTGHTTSGTQWNTDFTNGSPFTTPAFSLDADGTTFTTAELTEIQNIWQDVAEDYAPFDVNVTTKDPPIGDLINTGSGDSRWGVRVVIGGTDSQWFTGSAGGVAYLTSFTWASDTPCFVFADTQLDREDYIVLAASHEAGHTLGLNHDGTAILGYYGGHGTGNMSWAPIMGAGYNISITQWSKGEYPGANNHEDDLAVITTQNGFGYRPDD